MNSRSQESLPANSLQQSLAKSLTLSAAQRDEFLKSMAADHPEWSMPIDDFVQSVVERPLDHSSGVTLADLNQETSGPASPGSLTGGAELPRDTDEFRFVGLLGQGAMGIVFEAEELSTGRHLAVKLIATEGALDESSRKRFRLEAELAAAVTHPHSVFVYGAHDVHGVPAMSMELMGGETLHERKGRDAGVSAGEALGWLGELTGALAASHGRGVLHRDIKPANCYLTGEGQTKLGDYGLARAVEGDLQLTRSGSFLGSPAYASPEQLRGAPLDERSDIYSLGATFYDLLTGHPPHNARSFGELCAQVHTQALGPLRAERPDVPHELADLIERMLSLDPDHRPASAPVLAAELALLQEGRPAYFVRRWVAFWAVDMALFLALAVSGSSWSETSQVDMVMIAFLVYIPVAEGLSGRTLGKILLGLTLTTVRRGCGWLRRAGRSLIGIVWMVGTTGMGDLGWIGEDAQQLIFYLGLALLYIPFGRRLHRTSLADRLTGTRVLALVTDPTDVGARVRTPTPCTRDEIRSYTISGELARAGAGQLLLGLDPVLQRVVWLSLAPQPLNVPEKGAAELPRLIEQFSEGDDHVAVFERIRGAPLQDALDGGGALSWDLACRWLAQPALYAAPAHRVWITDENKVVVLPFAVTAQDDERASVVVARAVLGDDATVPDDVPTTAVALLLGLAESQHAEVPDGRSAAINVSRPDLAAGGVAAARLRQALLCACSMLPGAVMAGVIVDLPWQMNEELALLLLAHVAAPALASLLFVLVKGRALTFFLLGLDLRRSTDAVSVSRAGPLGRPRWLARTAAFWALLFVAVAAVGATVSVFGGDDLQIVASMTRSGILLMAGPVIWAWLSPAQGLADKFTGTKVVRR